jgi:pimeloyl-ACP methyl ester carboxylesterase
MKLPDSAPPPLLVLLPGLDGTGKLFASFLLALDGAIDTLVIGYPTEEPLGYEALEGHVRARLPSDRAFVLLGESFGGPIAIRLAASPPPGLTGLILCGTFAKNPYPLLGWAGPFTFLVPLKSLPRWVRAPLMWGTKDPVRVPVQAERAIAGVSDAVVRRRIAEILRVDVGALLSRIAVPTLILYACQDRVISRAATRWLAERLPRARQVGIDGPHLLLQARPGECAGAVAQFMGVGGAQAGDRQEGTGREGTGREG